MIREKMNSLKGDKYDPFYCVAVQALMCSGASIAEVSLRLRVTRSRLMEWQEQYPEFKKAFEDGMCFSLGWWEAVGRTHLGDKNFNSVLWLMNMVNRFGYVRGDIPAQGNGQTPANIVFEKSTHNHVHFDGTQCSKSELSTLANILRKARGGSQNDSGRPRKELEAKEV
jgi:hypothetical protein